MLSHKRSTNVCYPIVTIVLHISLGWQVSCLPSSSGLVVMIWRHLPLGMTFICVCIKAQRFGCSETLSLPSAVIRCVFDLLLASDKWTSVIKTLFL